MTEELVTPDRDMSLDSEQTSEKKRSSWLYVAMPLVSSSYIAHIAGASMRFAFG